LGHAHDHKGISFNGFRKIFHNVSVKAAYGSIGAGT
jgi:hypothetical protein